MVSSLVLEGPCLSLIILDSSKGFLLFIFVLNMTITSEGLPGLPLSIEGDGGIQIEGERFDWKEVLETGVRVETDTGWVEVAGFGNHPMNMRRRYGPMTELSLVDDDQNRVLVKEFDGEELVGWVLPQSGEGVVARVGFDHNSSEGEVIFKVDLFEVVDGEIRLVEVVRPDKDAKILHATQILGHVKDACDMQEVLARQGRLDEWEFAFPPTKRRAVNQSKLRDIGVPTDQVTRSWVYGPESEELPSDFRKPESFETVMGFVAANTELCTDVARGKFAVVSTNFKQEAAILKAINPDVVTVGVNFTFLHGRVVDQIERHADLPKLQRMLSRVQDSLDAAPGVLAQIAGREVEVADWWRLTAEKMVGLDLLLFRTFSFDETIPRKVGETEVMQIPHPVPEVRFSREQSREHVGKIIGRSLREEERVVLLPGASEDGLFAKRLDEVRREAVENPDLLVLMPLSDDDPRLVGEWLPENVMPIGFREDWMDVLPAADAIFIRGSWGEILDVIAAGVVPVLMSPGTVPTGGDMGQVQFLTEVSGERAVNVSLLVSELKKNGVLPEVVAGLLADVADENSAGEVRWALRWAIDPKNAEMVRAAMENIKKDGIEWIVRLHQEVRNRGVEAVVDDRTIAWRES